MTIKLYCKSLILDNTNGVILRYEHNVVHVYVYLSGLMLNVHGQQLMARWSDALTIQFHSRLPIGRLRVHSTYFFRHLPMHGQSKPPKSGEPIQVSPDTNGNGKF